MKLTLTLQTDEAIALRRLANADGVDLTTAAQMAIRELLICIGMLELPHEPDEGAETISEA